MIKKNLKPKFNSLLEQTLGEDQRGTIDEVCLNADCKTIWFEEPFAHIKNFSESRKKLERYCIWISYGGQRSGSTFTTMALKILLASISENFLLGWEGDFRKPIKFFELVQNNPTIDSGILKIHYSEEFCNKMLEQQKAKAVVSIRDYPSIAASYKRMKENLHSPFYSKERITDEQVISFIANELSEHKKKQALPNTLFIREDIIRLTPHKAVLSIAEHMGLDLSTSSANVIGDALNIQSQKERQRYIIINSTGHSQDSFLHYEHINPVEHKLDKHLWDLVFEHFGDQLNEDGYLRLE